MDVQGMAKNTKNIYKQSMKKILAHYQETHDIEPDVSFLVTC